MAFINKLKRFVSSAIGDDDHIESLRKKAIATITQANPVSHHQGLMLHKDDTYESGTRLVDSTYLASIQATMDKKILQIGGVRIPAGLEQRSFLLTGAQGQGKSVSLCRIYDTIRARGQKAVVYDPTGEFIAKYYREGIDHIFNPLDSRTITWNLYKDYDKSSYDHITNLIPDGVGDAAIWSDSAKVLMRILLNKTNSIDELIFTINSSTDGELKKIMTLAGEFGKIGAPATFSSVRFNVSNYCDSLQLQKNVVKGSTSGFSVEEYFADEASDAWVFLPMISSHTKLLGPLISLFFDTLVIKGLELEVDRDRRIWMCIDELPSLPKLPSLTPVLAQGRKYGFILVLGVQQKSQLESTYGKTDADTLWGLLATKLFLATTESASAESMSLDIGKTKVYRRKVSTSTSWVDGDHSKGSFGHNRETPSISNELVEINAVMASEITGLQALYGYLIMSGTTINKKEVAYVHISFEGLTESHGAPAFCKGIVRDREMVMENVKLINPAMYLQFQQAIDAASAK